MQQQKSDKWALYSCLVSSSLLELKALCLSTKGPFRRSLLSQASVRWAPKGHTFMSCWMSFQNAPRFSRRRCRRR